MKIFLMNSTKEQFTIESTENLSEYSFVLVVSTFKITESFLTPTPSPFIETMVNAANNVMMTPTTNAVGMIAKLKRLNRWCPKVRAAMEKSEQLVDFKNEKEHFGWKHISKAFWSINDFFFRRVFNLNRLPMSEPNTFWSPFCKSIK